MQTQKKTISEPALSKPNSSLRELPPTAGMPLLWQDIVAGFSWREASGDFHSKLSAFLEFSEIDLYSSGTLCLSFAFEAVREITGRKKIIIPAYTCPLVAIAAHVAGAEVILCDTETNGIDMDLEMLERICNREVAAVVATDLGGLPCNISRIREIAQSSSAFVVEDAAQSLGARLNEHPVGTNADIAVYSLAAGKGMSLYDGGIIATENLDLRKALRDAAARRVKRKPALNLLRAVQILGLWLLYNPVGLPLVYGNELRHWLRKNDPVRAVGDYFEFDIPAYEFENFRKRIGAAALKRLPEFLRDNRKRGLIRAEILRKKLGFIIPAEIDNAEGSWPFITLLTQSEDQRNLIMDQLWQSGLGVTRLFIHELPSYDYLQAIIPKQDMPNARSFAERSFTLTNSHYLSDEDFAVVVENIHRVCK